MFKRSFCAAMALMLLLALTPAALAADASAMTDISGHWAEENIVWVMKEDLFNGVSDTEFAPDSSMTRGMFVTVLGRLAQVDQDDYRDPADSEEFADVADGMYYAPYILWATRLGITKGTGEDTFSPDEKVSRQQMAAFIVRFADALGYELAPITDQIAEGFSDEDSISAYAVEAVEAMRTTGLLTGYSNGDGTCSFNPEAFTTRAECATIFRRLTLSIYAEVPPTDPTDPADPTDPTEPEEPSVPEEPSEPENAPTGITLSKTDIVLRPGETVRLSAKVTPADADDTSVTWVSSDNAVATVTSDGIVTHIAQGEAVIYAYTSNDLSAACRVYCSKGYVGSASDTYAEKCIGLFGEYVSDPRSVYATQAEAKAHMVTISVKVWDFSNASQTAKVTKTRNLTVHENLAETVTLIFDEIYRCTAKYPINSVGGYGWRGSGSSEHTTGLAVDINYMQNYYCDAQGNAITGSHFDPENDPYSMPIDGEIQKIFEKYGFTRGIYWNSGKKDYMHYSFFGT